MLTQSSYIQAIFSSSLILLSIIGIISGVVLLRKVLSKRIKINKSGISIEEVRHKRRESDK